MKQAIQVTESGIADIFALPCVRAITKSYMNRGFVVHLFDHYSATDGDWLCCYGGNDWRVLSNEQYQKIKSNE